MVACWSMYMEGSILSHSLKKIASEHDFQKPPFLQREKTTILVDSCHLLGLAKLEEPSHVQRNHMGNSHAQGWQPESSHPQNWKIKWVTAGFEASGSSATTDALADQQERPIMCPFIKSWAGLCSADTLLRHVCAPPSAHWLTCSARQMWLSQHSSIGCC